MRNKISSFLLNSAKSKGLSDIYVAQIDTIKESLAGKIFVLAEFSNGKKSDWKKIFDFIVSSLEENYYNDEKLLLKDKIEGLKVENIFEAALARTNLDLNDFLETEKIKLSTNSVNLSVGVVFENKLHFSNFGKNRALLIYKQKAGYEMINVETNAFEKNDEEILLEDGRSVPKTPKIFSSIISGEIPKNAFFVFTSESILEYLSEKELVTIISKLPPLTAASQIKNVLEQINSFVPFFGLIIKSASEIDPSEALEDIEEMPHMHRLASSLSHTEKRTEEMLSSSGLVTWNRIKNSLKDIIKDKDSANEKSLKLVKSKSRHEEEVEEKVEKEVEVDFENEDFAEEDENTGIEIAEAEIEEDIDTEEMAISDSGEDFAEEIYEEDVDEEIIEQIIKKEEIEEIIETVAEKTREVIHPEINSIKTVSIEKKFFRPDSSAVSVNKLPSVNFKFSSILKPFTFVVLFFKNAFGGGSGRKRMAAGILAALFIVLVASIWLTAINNKNKAIQEEFARLAQEIENKEAAINMRLLYDDTEGAKSILNEARESLSQLPQKNNEQIAAYTALMERLDAGQEKVYRITRLNNSEEVFDLSAKAVAKINFAGDKIIAFAGDKAYSLNIKDNKSTEYNLSNDYTNHFNQYDGQKTVFLLKAEKLSKFDITNGKESVVSLKGLDGNSSFQAFNVYATNRLYLLDKTKNEIIVRSGGSYANSATWLKESADLSQAEGLFVNGSIFILNKDGSVNKYHLGKKESYNAAAIEPKLGDFKKITGTDSKLYLFDPSAKRLAVLDINKGTLIAQYIFESAQDAKDVVVDEKNNQVYLLDGEKVYRYKLN